MLLCLYVTLKINGKSKSWVYLVALNKLLYETLHFFDSKIQAQLYNLNPDIVGNLCMHLDNLGLHMLYPTSSNLGSFFFFLTQYVSLLILQWFANLPPKSSSLIPCHKTFQILDLTPIQNMACYWNPVGFSVFLAYHCTGQDFRQLPGPVSCLILHF